MSQGNENIKLLVRSQLPDHISADYSTFVEFLETYYEFVKQQHSIKIESIRDVDTISENLLIFLQRELLRDFPGSFIDKRKLTKTIRDVYKRKGNIDSLKLLFKLFFNDSIIIKQPGEQILRASDGKWFQYYGITLSQINWDLISQDLARAAVQIQPYKDLFDTPISELSTRKIGDINNSGSVTLADSLIVKRFDLNPESVTTDQLTFIKTFFLPFILSIEDPEILNRYVYSQFNAEDVVDNVSTIIIENKYGRFTPIVSFIEVEENKKVRVFFKNYNFLKVDLGEDVSITGETGSVVFTGKVIPSYSGLEILSPGKNWQKGQVFTIPGTVKDTVVRVKETTFDGEITQVEIIDYGFSHDNELAFFASPYPVKPSSTSSYDIDAIPIAITNGEINYNYIISLKDYTEGVLEEVFAEIQQIDYIFLATQIELAANGVEPAATLFNTVVSGFKLGDINHSGTVTVYDATLLLRFVNNPFSVSQTEQDHINNILLPGLISLADNVDPNNPPSYTGILFEIVNPFLEKVSFSTTETTSIRFNFSELTFEEWATSRALFRFKKAEIFKTKGYYINDDSQISNTESRLQDNYFYQIFSYLIETTKTGEEVYELLNQFHPAGMKYFIDSYKKNYYSLVDLIVSFKSLSIDNVYLSDGLFINDDIDEKIFEKVISDTEFLPVDTDPIKFFTKVSTDQTTTNDTDIKKVFTKVSTDQTTTNDTDIKKAFTKVSTDQTNTNDSNIKKAFTKVSTDQTNTNDSNIKKAFTKVSTDQYAASTLKVVKTFIKAPDSAAAVLDQPAKNIDKYEYEDSFTIDEGQLLSVTSKGYGVIAENYSAEKYNQIAIDAYIG